LRISIIGSGVVGKATGIGFHKFGHEIIFNDINGKSLASLREEGYKVTEDINEAVRSSTISFICVPTPTRARKIVFSYVKEATVSIAKALHKKDRTYHLIVVRSTVLPTTTRTRIIPLLEKHSKLKAGKDFGVCVNPEFLRQATALQDFLNPSRIVIGELDKQSGDLLENLYAPFKAPIIRTSLDTAEMIKYVANCFLTTKISYFNEVYLICKKLQLDPHLVAEAVALDPRIGNYGIYGGRPFSGACLPKDLEAFINFAKKKGVNPKLLEAVNYVNKKISEEENKTA
jgi:UDPglucose 6-dehydrogenase